MKTVLNSSFCAVTADSKSRRPQGRKSYFRCAQTFSEFTPIWQRVGCNRVFHNPIPNKQGHHPDFVPLPDPARITQAPKAELRPSKGYNVTMKCVASGYPAPTYVWRNQGGSQITTHGRTRVKNGELTIVGVLSLDKGAYTCEASSGDGTVDKATSTIVEVYGMSCGLTLEWISDNPLVAHRRYYVFTSLSVVSVLHHGLACNSVKVAIKIRIGWKVCFPRWMHQIVHSTNLSVSTAARYCVSWPLQDV